MSLLAKNKGLYQGLIEPRLDKPLIIIVCGEKYGGGRAPPLSTPLQQFDTPYTSMQSASYCEMYPVDGYVLEVVDPTLHRIANIKQSTSNGTLSVNSLLDNQAYSFSVVVSNSVGNASTGNITICESIIFMNVL